MKFLNEECCACDSKMSMCRNKPCRGTVEEMKAIIDAGFGDNLAVRVWLGSTDETEKLIQTMLPDYKNPFREDVYLLSPKTIGTDSLNNFPYDIGQCIFFDAEKKCCSLYEKGLQPSQGAKSCCKKEPSLGVNNLLYTKVWATDKGKNLLKEWVAQYGTEEDEKRINTGTNT